MFNKVGLVSLFAVSLVLTGCFAKPDSQNPTDMTTGTVETGGDMKAMMEETNNEMDAMMGTGTTGDAMKDDAMMGTGTTGTMMMDKTSN